MNRTLKVAYLSSSINQRGAHVHCGPPPKFGGCTEDYDLFLLLIGELLGYQIEWSLIRLEHFYRWAGVTNDQAVISDVRFAPLMINYSLGGVDAWVNKWAISPVNFLEISKKIDVSQVISRILLGVVSKKLYYKSVANSWLTPFSVPAWAMVVANVLAIRGYRLLLLLLQGRHLLPKNLAVPPRNVVKLSTTRWFTVLIAWNSFVLFRAYKTRVLANAIPIDKYRPAIQSYDELLRGSNHQQGDYGPKSRYYHPYVVNSQHRFILGLKHSFPELRSISVRRIQNPDFNESLYDQGGEGLGLGSKALYLMASHVLNHPTAFILIAKPWFEQLVAEKPELYCQLAFVPAMTTMEFYTFRSFRNDEQKAAGPSTTKPKNIAKELNNALPEYFGDLFDQFRHRYYPSIEEKCEAGNGKRDQNNGAGQFEPLRMTALRTETGTYAAVLLASLLIFAGECLLIRIERHRNVRLPILRRSIPRWGILGRGSSSYYDNGKNSGSLRRKYSETVQSLIAMQF